MVDILEELITHADPKSATSEAFRCLRTNIQFLNAGKKSQVVVVTSSAPREGKTFVSANLAVVSAQSNKKTLLVDCDLRRPYLHKLFGASGREGISSVLARESVSLKDIPPGVTKIENLSFISSGPIPPNPAELLERKAMDEFLSAAREEFDIIYIDTPPLLSVTDPIIVAKKADGVILVVMADVTPKKAALRSYNILKEAGANIIGTVFNRVDTGIGGYYKYYRYRYYKDYYSK